MAKITDAEIVAALLSNPTNQAAADALGITIRHLYTRMEKPSFQQLYKSAQQDLMSDAVNLARRNLSKAVEVIAEIMSNPEISPQIRINAAAVLLRNATRLQTAQTEQEWDSFFGPPCWR